MNSRSEAKSVSIYIDSSILKRLDDLCKTYRSSRSRLINEFLDERIAYYEEMEQDMQKYLEEGEYE